MDDAVLCGIRIQGKRKLVRSYFLRRKVGGASPKHVVEIPLLCISYALIAQFLGDNSLIWFIGFSTYVLGFVITGKWIHRGGGVLLRSQHSG